MSDESRAGSTDTARVDDAIIVGGGLAGLVTACGLLDAGLRVTIVDQEPEQSLGGQAWWSFGGLFLVNSPEQRRLRVKDSRALARQDWFASADFDRPEDEWARAWADAYLDFATDEARDWLTGLGIRFFPVVAWAERGGDTATAHGNSVPRFHITWGTGPGLLEPFIARFRAGVDDGTARLLPRHRVDRLLTQHGAVVGVSGSVLAPDDAQRGAPSNRDPIGRFELRAPRVVVASGGIGGDHGLVREFWPAELGTPPTRMLTGVPAHVDGRMLDVAARAGARLVNRDRMWHYVEGVANHSAVWPGHGIRILPGPSSLWLDARGRRLPVPLFPGFDTRGTLEWLRRTGSEHSWFVTTEAVAAKEFALSGSEQNPDLTGRNWRLLVRERILGRSAPPALQQFFDNGDDFLLADTLDDLLGRMRDANDGVELDTDSVRYEIEARDAELANRFSKDAQLTAIRGARRFLGDRLIRVAKPHRILDGKHGRLVAVKLHVLTRKSLGGVLTDLHARALDGDGEPVPGLYAVGEAAGFGGGGMHGYRALEGTFLGGCLFTGRIAARAIAAEAAEERGA